MYISPFLFEKKLFLKLEVPTVKIQIVYVNLNNESPQILPIKHFKHCLSLLLTYL